MNTDFLVSLPFLFPQVVATLSDVPSGLTPMEKMHVGDEPMSLYYSPEVIHP